MNPTYRLDAREAIMMNRHRIVPDTELSPGSVTLDARRLGRDASRITEEVVRHLSSIVGADVQITLDIQAELPENASDKLVRDVTENCRTLKFDEFGFEEK